MITGRCQLSDFIKNKNIPADKVEIFIKKLKEEWRIKSRRMEIMSGDVAIYELEQILSELAGAKLTK
jgi:hypothetical protein